MAINQSALADGIRKVRYDVARAFPGVRFTLELRNWGQSVLIALDKCSAEVAYDPLGDDATNTKSLLEACGKLLARVRAKETVVSSSARRRAFRAKQRAMRPRRLVASGIRRALSRNVQVPA